jgi:hypothetical protein
MMGMDRKQVERQGLQEIQTSLLERRKSMPAMRMKLVEMGRMKGSMTISYWHHAGARYMLVVNG